MIHPPTSTEPAPDLRFGAGNRWREHAVAVRCGRHLEEMHMKVRTSLRSLKNKPGAQVIRRHGKVYVINKKNPRDKARQG